MSLELLPEMLADNPGRRMRFVSLDGGMITKSFAEMHADVTQLQSELRSAGLEAEDLVGLLGPNSYEWAIADLALLGMRCVSVAIASEGQIGPDDLRELTERYQLAALLVTRVVPPGVELPPATALLEARPLRLRPERRAAADRPALPADVFTIAFSSGTAGTKKGLMMTREGVVNTIRVSARAWQVRADDDLLIVMPFSNFQQRYLMYLAIWAGCAACVVPPERMYFLLAKLEPTIILGPPSFFELVGNRVAAASPREKAPFYLALLLNACAPGDVSRRLRARLGRKWTRVYGSRARLMFTGSAPVPPRMVKLFQRLGAPLFEVYGSTEVGWITFNLPRAYRVGASGRPVDGIALEIADDSEVIVRAAHPQVAGYVFEGAESAGTVFLPDGRIATGDLGRVDPAGFLWLTGRKKNVIITRSGVKINPEELESEIEAACPVTRAVVVPVNSSGLLACVAWLEDDRWDEHTALVDAHIAQANKLKPASHRISTTIFRPARELTVESRLLTRNFKIDRNMVMQTVLNDESGLPR